MTREQASVLTEAFPTPPATPGTIAWSRRMEGLIAALVAVGEPRSAAVDMALETVLAPQLRAKRAAEAEDPERFDGLS